MPEWQMTISEAHLKIKDQNPKCQKAEKIGIKMNIVMIFKQLMITYILTIS